MSLVDLDFNLDYNQLMFALVSLMFLWLFFRIFKRTEKPRGRVHVSRKSAGWDHDSYVR
jgi:membrane protein implicated in regulation of membrane protease activity